MLAFAVGSSAIAQTQPKGNRPPHEGAKKAMVQHHQMKQAQIAKKLDLTPDQSTKIKSINETFKQQMQELQKNESITVKEQRERREALIKQHKESLQAILTPEQKDKMKKAKKEEMAKMDKHLQFEHLKKQLDLTEQQQQQLKTINEEFKTKAQTLHKDDALTKAQKKEQFDALQKQHMEQIQSVLTAEQKAKMEQFKKNRPNRKTV